MPTQDKIINAVEVRRGCKNKLSAWNDVVGKGMGFTLQAFEMSGNVPTYAVGVRSEGANHRSTGRYVAWLPDLIVQGFQVFLHHLHSAVAAMAAVYSWTKSS